MQSEIILLPRGSGCGYSLVLPARVIQPALGVQTHVIIVPGNPGIASFYTPFAEALHARLGGRASVRAVNLLGFVPQDHRTVVTHSSDSGCGHGHAHSHTVSHPVLPSLGEQVAFLAQYLRALRLQLECADELAQGLTAPAPLQVPNLGPVGVEQLLSPAVRFGSTSSPHFPRRHRFVLVCHSIGAYIGLGAMDIANREAAAKVSSSSALASLIPFLTSGPLGLSLPSVEIAHSFLLFPFVRMDLPVTTYWGVRGLLASSWFVQLLVRLFALAPISVWRLALRVAMNIRSEHAVRALYGAYTDSSIVAAGVSLGASEFVQVHREAPEGCPKGQEAARGFFDPAMIANHVRQVTMYYAGAEHDIWGPLSQMKSLKKTIPHLDARVEPTATHAWCAYQGQSITMAKRVAQDLDDLELRWMVDGGATLPHLTQATAATTPAASAVLVSKL